MRKRKTVFFDSLLALGLSWGVTAYLNKSDEESVFLMASSLLLICTLVLIPVALRSLNTGKSFRGGIYFLLMLLPLVVAVSHPAFSFHVAPFMASAFEGSGALDFSRWGINMSVNGSIFFLTGVIFTRLNSKHKINWKITAFTAFIMAAFYILSFYTAVHLFGKSG